MWVVWPFLLFAHDEEVGMNRLKAAHEAKSNFSMIAVLLFVEV